MGFSGRIARFFLTSQLTPLIALIAALVDIPVFARTTVDPTAQVDAAVLLERFLLAVCKANA